MVVWTIIVMLLAFIGIITNILWGMPLKVSFHDIIIFLIALGILIRIRYKTREGEKEKLQKTINELNADKK